MGVLELDNKGECTGLRGCLSELHGWPCALDASFLRLGAPGREQTNRCIFGAVASAGVSMSDNSLFQRRLMQRCHPRECEKCLTRQSWSVTHHAVHAGRGDSHGSATVGDATVTSAVIAGCCATDAAGGGDDVDGGLRPGIADCKKSVWWDSERSATMQHS